MERLERCNYWVDIGNHMEIPEVEFRGCSESKDTKAQTSTQGLSNMLKGWSMSLWEFSEATRPGKHTKSYGTWSKI